MSKTSYVTGLAAVLYLVKISAAHEHHNDEIPEGEAVSAKPLVRAILFPNPFSS